MTTTRTHHTSRDVAALCSKYFRARLREGFKGTADFVWEVAHALNLAWPVCNLKMRRR